MSIIYLSLTIVTFIFIMQMNQLCLLHTLIGKFLTLLFSCWVIFHDFCHLLTFTNSGTLSACKMVLDQDHA